MERLRELLAPNTFNKFGYIGVLLWAVIGVILVGVSLKLDHGELSDFRCMAKPPEKDFVRAKCLKEYNKRHRKWDFPMYGFLLINFFVIEIVSAVYSLFMTSTVEDLRNCREAKEAEPVDAERQRPPKTRRLFMAYSCQLLVRLVLGVVAMALQTKLFYPKLHYLSDFNCDLSSPAANASSGKNSTTFECLNQRASEKTYLMHAVIVVNGIFAGAIFIEVIVILVLRAKLGTTFLNDSQFLKYYLDCSCTCAHHRGQDRDQEPPEEPPRGPHDSLDEFIKSLKKSIIEETEKPPDLRALFQPKPGEGERIKDLKIDSIYTQLVLIPNRAEYDFSGNREEQLKVYPMRKETLQPLKNPEEIVDAENKITLMVGRPGIGKTLFCTKFLRDWASDKVFNKTQDTELYYEMAFLINFRKFNWIKQLSLRELLTGAEYLRREGIPDELWRYIREDPDRVLIFFDGFDEMKDISSIAELNFNDNYANSEEQAMPLAVVYSKLVNGKLLRGATIVTTTRPNAVSSFGSTEFGKTVEIIGFSSDQVQEYVENFTEEAEESLSNTGTKIWQHISTNMNLFSLCYVPVNCFIICSCLLQIILHYTKKGKDLTGAVLPEKFTQIYKIAMRLFFFRHNEQYKDKFLSQEEIERDKFPPEVEEKTFKPLGKVAFNGVKERRLIFDKSEVQGLEASGLLHQLPDDERNPFHHEAQFCFIHLTMQEFLAAKHIVDTMNKAQLRRFVSKNIKKGEWHVVLQFAAGLLGERERPIEIFTDMLPVKTVTRDSGSTYWPTGSDKHLALTILKCLFESGENKEPHLVVKSKLEKIGFNAVDFSYCGLAPCDCTAVVQALKSVPQVSCIELYNNHISSLGCVEIRKLLDNGNCQLTALRLGSNNIDDNGVLELCKIITNSKLTELGLSMNKITDVGVNNLCNALTNPNCKLLRLDLRGNEAITAEAKQRIIKAKRNCKFFI